MEINSFLQRLPGGQALNTAKDRLLAKGAKARFYQLLQRYGTMLDFRLNTSDRSLFVSLLLKGEQTPIEIHIREYELIQENGQTFVRIDGGKIETSREWLTSLVQEKIGQQKLPVPEKFAWLVQLLN